MKGRLIAVGGCHLTLPGRWKGEQRLRLDLGRGRRYEFRHPGDIGCIVECDAQFEVLEASRDGDRTHVVARWIKSGAHARTGQTVCHLAGEMAQWMIEEKAK